MGNERFTMRYTIAHERTEHSEWRCELLGCGKALVLRPAKDQVPNAFWRLMQYLILGNKWIKGKRNEC